MDDDKDPKDRTSNRGDDAGLVEKAKDLASSVFGFGDTGADDIDYPDAPAQESSAYTGAASARVVDPTSRDDAGGQLDDLDDAVDDDLTPARGYGSPIPPAGETDYRNPTDVGGIEPE
jgi:hypothetical protein